MRTLVDYLDAAKAKSGMSDLELGFRIGYKSLVVYQLRKGQRTINEDAMMKLADVAGIPREEAALDLAIWRAKGTEAAPVYERMAAMLRSVVLSGLLVVAFWGVTCVNQLHAAESLGKEAVFSQDKIENVYYG